MAPADGKDASPPPPASRLALPGAAEENVPERSLRLKLAASEDLCRRLQDHVFALEDDIHAAALRIDLLKNESAMNAEGLRCCVEEKEAMAAARDQIAAHAARLEKKCGLYERDLERDMEACDELRKAWDELHKRLVDAPDVTALNKEVEALQIDKEILRTNLNKSEEEVKLLFKENKRLLCLLEKEQKHRSKRKHSAGNSTKQKQRRR